jgi:hypothetical protein
MNDKPSIPHVKTAVALEEPSHFRQAIKAYWERAKADKVRLADKRK